MNYYNQMIEWTDNIKEDTDIETVQKNVPEYLEVDWNNPDTVSIENNRIRYEIIKIKGNNDILNMRNYLVFINDKYKARIAIK